MLSPDENARAVVKPNPDFSNGIAFFNHMDGLLNSNGTIPDSTYWSIGFYSPNTINFFVKNDQEFDSKEFNVILDRDTCSNATVHSQTNTGFILVRYLCKNHSVQEIAMYSTLLNILVIE